MPSEPTVADVIAAYEACLEILKKEPLDLKAFNKATRHRTEVEAEVMVGLVLDRM